MSSQEFAKLFGGYERTKAGVMVDQTTALRVSAVFACVNLISQTVAGLPLALYQTQERGKKKADAHTLYPIIHNMPNPETTQFDFWQMLLVNLLLTGDGFAVIKRNGDNVITGLWNVPTSAVTKCRNTQTEERYYLITENGKQYKYYPENILHIQGMRFNSTDNPLDPISVAREALGLAIATESYGSDYFAGGATPGGVAEFPGALSDEAFDRFKTSFMSQYSKLGTSNRILFLEDGAK
jgi:HK97 family phage portal protein